LQDPGTTPFVFVCYSHDDARRVLPIAQWLGQEGVGVWYDAEMRAGSVWRREIADALNRATHVLFFASSASIASDHCDREVQYALDHSKTVVPVFLEDAQLTPSLSLALARVHSLYAFRLTAAELRQQLLEAISPAAIIGVVDAAPAVPRRRRPRRRQIAVAALAVVAMTVLLTYADRVPIGTWLALNLPRVLAHPVKEQIGFTTTSDGVRIAYATAGHGSPVVMVLGWLTHLTEGIGSALYDSAGVGQWYTKDHLVVHYDGRGFGLSDRNVTDFSLDARVRDIEAVVAALRLKRFALYGMSAGGSAAIVYAERHPEQVSRLILGATFLVGSGPTSAWHGIAELAEHNWRSPAARAAVVEILAPGSTGVQRGVLMHFLETAADGHAIAGFVNAIDEVDVTAEARNVRVPTLVIAGTADTAVTLDESRAVAAAIPGARFEVIEGASHLEAGILDPRVMRMVSEFLTEPDSQR
jgi:pimeloyl-ACP methyl ester carboxylesterase